MEARTTVAISLLFAALATASRRQNVVISSSCFAVIPVLPNSGPGCGVPEFVDQSEFGDNADATGEMTVVPRRRGLDLTFELKDLPRSDLTLTAWLIWALPGNPSNPAIFQQV